MDRSDFRDQPFSRPFGVAENTSVGQHSIRINDQWRICFYWKDGDAYDAEIVDYH
jgi:proteic killer suppression protein